MIDTAALQDLATQFKTMDPDNCVGAEFIRTEETEQDDWSFWKLGIDSDRRVCKLSPLIDSDETNLKGLAFDAAVASGIGDTAESWFDYVGSTGKNQIPGFTGSESIYGAHYNTRAIFIEKLCGLCAAVCGELVRRARLGARLPTHLAQLDKNNDEAGPPLLVKKIIRNCERNAAGVDALMTVEAHFRNKLEEANKLSLFDMVDQTFEGARSHAIESVTIWIGNWNAVSPIEVPIIPHLARVAALRSWRRIQIPSEYWIARTEQLLSISDSPTKANGDEVVKAYIQAQQQEMADFESAVLAGVKSSSFYNSGTVGRSEGSSFGVHQDEHRALGRRNKAEIRKWMHTVGIVNLDEAAKRLNVSKSILKSIMGQTRDRRHSPETCDRVMTEVRSGQAEQLANSAI